MCRKSTGSLKTVIRSQDSESAPIYCGNKFVSSRRLKVFGRTGAISLSLPAAIFGAAIILGTAVIGISFLRDLQQPSENTQATTTTGGYRLANRNALDASGEVGALGDSADNLPSGFTANFENLHPVVINRPSGPPKLDSGIVDWSGNPVLIECSVCHSTRTPNFANRSSNDLVDFHRDIQVTHGNVSCLSCHNPDDYQSLRLADGTRVEFENVMQLCGQCHGPQLRDYERGAHGGMNGYWDLRRGPQFKNNCIDCHQPHHPKFPLMQTGFKPHDRFLPAQGMRSERGDAHE